MVKPDFNKWLSAFASGLCEQEPAEISLLFSETGVYHPSPFYAPVTGRAAVTDFFKRELSLRHESRFQATRISFERQVGWAHWSCTFTRRGTEDPVRQEGICQIVFDDDGLCEEFRQWWNVLEPGQGDLMRDFDA